MMIVEKISNIH